MATSPRTGTSPSRRGRPSAPPAPSVTELRDAVKTATQQARLTRQQAKEAASELKRLTSALDKARKAAAKQKAAAKTSRTAAPKQTRTKTVSRPAAGSNGGRERKGAQAVRQASPRRGRPPKALAEAPAAVVAA